MTQHQIERERQILRALCSDMLDVATRADCVARLAAYRFRDPSHQVLFEILADLSSSGAPLSAARLRELLPARANKRGFPDLDFESLFASSTISSEETMRLVDSLLKTSA